MKTRKQYWNNWKIFIFFFFIFHISHLTFAQDIHFSQFYASPLTLNPATVGVMRGDFRFVGNYRNQWNSVTVPFETFAASFDINLFPGFRKSDAISMGVVFFNDKAGDSELSNTQTHFVLGYDISLGEKTHQHINFGFMGGYGYRSINYDRLVFDNQIQNDQIDRSAASGEENLFTNYSYIDVSGGAMWYYSPSEKFNMYLGTALFHINNPNQSFTTDRSILFRKFVLHGGSQFALGKHFSILPSLMYLLQGREHNEFNLGSFVKFNMEKKAGFALGAWTRFTDALVVAGRADIRQWSIGVSYDVNYSSLVKASKLRAGPEFSVIYVGTLPASMKRGLIEKRKVNCPTFN